MTGFVQMVIAGIAGLLALKLVGWIFSGLGFAVGVAVLLLKIGFVLLVGWFVLRILRGKRQPAI